MWVWTIGTAQTLVAVLVTPTAVMTATFIRISFVDGGFVIEIDVRFLCGSVFCVGFSDCCFTLCALKPRDCWLFSVSVSVVFYVAGISRVGWTSSMTTPITLNCLGFLAGFSLIEIALMFVRAAVRLRPAIYEAWPLRSSFLTSEKLAYHWARFAIFGEHLTIFIMKWSLWV